MEEFSPHLRPSIQAFREHAYGVVSHQKNPPDHSNDNAHLFSAHYIMNVQFPELETYWYMAFVRACEIYPGFYLRYPHSPGKESWDDLIGIASVSHRLRLPFATDIMAWGESHEWTWNNEAPREWTAQSYLGRFPAFIGFLRVAAGGAMSPFEQLAFCISLLLSVRGDETSTKCLFYLMTRTVYGRHKITDFVIVIWRALMLKKYPRGMREVYRIYFSRDDHPLGQFGPEGF